MGEPCAVLGQGFVGAITAQCARIAGALPVIVTDLDGTFLDTYHTLNEENVKAVRRAREQGIYVAAVTARNWSACKWAVTETGFDPLCVILSLIHI